MKLYRATVATVFLLLAWTTLAAAAEDYSRCEPYCVSFIQIGDGHFAVAVDSRGRFLSATPIEGMAGPALTGARMAPWHPFEPFPMEVTWAGCKSTTTTAEYTTDTHHITVITTQTYCDGVLVDVTVTVIKVRLPAEQAPVDN